MNIDVAGIGALISGLTGLLVTAGTLMLQRQRKSSIDADDIEDELEIRNEQYQVALAHIRLHEESRAADTALPPIPRPEELRAGYFQERAQRGRKRRVGRHAAPDGSAASGGSGTSGAP